MRTYFCCCCLLFPSAIRTTDLRIENLEPAHVVPSIKHDTLLTRRSALAGFKLRLAYARASILIYIRIVHTLYGQPYTVGSQARVLAIIIIYLIINLHLSLNHVRCCCRLAYCVWYDPPTPPISNSGICPCCVLASVAPPPGNRFRAMRFAAAASTSSSLSCRSWRFKTSLSLRNRAPICCTAARRPASTPSQSKSSEPVGVALSASRCCAQ